MKKFVILFLLVFAFICAGNIFLFGQNKDLLSEANSLYASKNYSEAVDIYKRLLDNASTPNEKANVKYNLGMAYVQLGKFAEAENEFRSVLSMNVDNRELLGKDPRFFLNYHYNSQLEIGKMQFEKGDFNPALESFRNTRTKYPFLSNCGICIRDENVKLSIYEAATLEYLNRNKEAFNIYYKIAHPRLIEIYAANGQMEKLVKLIEKKDEPVIAEWMKKYSYSREKASGFLRSRNYKDFFNAYEQSKTENAATLMNDLRELAKTAQDSYLKDWTARMLAKNPRVAVPLISNELKNLQTYPYIFYRTLGFAATPEAIEILKLRAKNANGWYEAESIAASLMLAGEAGAAALLELEEKPLSANMKLAIQKYKNGELTAKNYLEVKFAPLKKTELPDEF
ncbi:hypothetical protein BH20ACI4_BH20ACI4_10940 [soil metagenome]